MCLHAARIVSRGDRGPTQRLRGRSRQQSPAAGPARQRSRSGKDRSKVVAGERIQNLSSAVDDFRRARRRAGLRALLARIRGESNELLSYEEVLRQLRGKIFATPTLEEIPLRLIRGSVAAIANSPVNSCPAAINRKSAGRG